MLLRQEHRRDGEAAKCRSRVGGSSSAGGGPMGQHPAGTPQPARPWRTWVLSQLWPAVKWAGGSGRGAGRGAARGACAGGSGHPRPMGAPRAWGCGEEGSPPPHAGGERRRVSRPGKSFPTWAGDIKQSLDYPAPAARRGRLRRSSRAGGLRLAAPPRGARPGRAPCGRDSPSSGTLPRGRRARRKGSGGGLASPQRGMLLWGGPPGWGVGAPRSRLVVGSRGTPG